MANIPSDTGKQAPRRFPFDHLSLAEVAECDRLLLLDRAGKLYGKAYGRLHALLARRHPPLYDAGPGGEPPERAA